MSFEVKICGISTPEAIEAAAAAGADAVGFIFAESVRQIGIERARELTRLCPPSLSRVAVFRHPAPDEVALVLESVDVDWVQSDAVDYEVIAEVLEGMPFRPVYRCQTNSATSSETDPHDGAPQATTADPAAALQQTIAAGERRGLNTGPVLIEGPRSGSGIAPDWQKIAALPRTLQVILAGGLTPANIREAVHQVRPVGVDTSSGVESERGVKDPERIAAFVTAARAAHEQLTQGARP